MNRTVSHRTWRTLSLCAALGMVPVLSLADGPAAAPAAPTPATRPASALPTLDITPGSEQTSLTAGGKKEPLPLDEKPFERMSAGISVRAPKGWTGIVEPDRDEIVRFVDDLKKQNWTLSITRRSFPKPQHLMAVKDDKGEIVPGIMENTLDALKSELAGAKVLRAGDPTNLGTHDVGVIVLRYTKNGEPRLAQHAIIQANDQLFYLLAFNSPGRKDVIAEVQDPNAEEKTVDPTERQAVQTFQSIIDSAKLLNLTPVREDQTQRLFRTRSLFYNITEKKILAAMVPERYLRILKNGTDVGYTYIVEGAGRPIKRAKSEHTELTIPGKTSEPESLHVDFDGAPGGFTVGIRTRLMTHVEGGKVALFPREDSECWLYSSMDRHNENWSRITVFDDGKEKTAANHWKKLSEVGTSAMKTRRVLSFDARDPNEPANQFRRGVAGDPGQPWVENHDNYSLDVQFKGTGGDLAPVQRPLPPFYMPAGLVELLPRLLPAKEPKAYLIATYVGESRQVMLQYIDVLPEAALPRELIPAGSSVTSGIPVDERIGYEGEITTHWVTVKGEYLGSVCKATHVILVPSDEQALKKIWSSQENLLHNLDADGGAGPQLTNPTSLKDGDKSGKR